MTHAATDYAQQAAEVTKAFVADYSRNDGLFAHSRKDRNADFMWGNGVTFSALVGAAKHDKQYRPRLSQFFTAMDRYWDKLAPVPGYEPAPTKGRGNDKYLDDNAWMVLTFLEAYDLTKDKRYLEKSKAALKFVLSGEDDVLGGGIWWHEKHKDDSKNTCVVAPAAVACLRLADYLPKKEADEAVATAKRLIEWTTTKLRLENGLFADKIDTKGKVERTTWTYNTGLMIRAYAGLYRHTKDAKWLDEAKATAKAAGQLIDQKHNAYRDGFKFTHLLVEADCELYRMTGDTTLLDRARANADYAYADWKARPHNELIENSSIARLLWVVADAGIENRGPASGNAVK